MEVIFITDQTALQNLVECCMNESALAIDTEFMRTNTYFAEPGLIQIAVGDKVYLIDPLRVDDLSVFAPLLESDSLVKVMHSMSEDVELLYHVTGARINNVFDTQVAAAFLGLGPSLGYQKLVHEILGLELDKSETRSDWLKRPLSESQLSYAAKDVEHLLTVYYQLLDRVVEKNLQAAVSEESATAAKQFFAAWDNPGEAYLKLRGGHELTIGAQRLLKELVEWRDTVAKTKNIPKPWVFSDACLIQIAERKPQSVADLKRIKDIQFKSVKRHGEILAQLVAHFEESDEPFQQIDRPVRGRELDYFQKLKSIVSQVANETGIASQLLGSRKMLERIVINVCRHGQKELPREYQGWRKSLLADRMAKAIGI